jgi:thiosulfate reductase cytochrome b subunit
MTNPSASNPPTGHVTGSPPPSDSPHIAASPRASANAIFRRREQPWLIRLTHWLNVPLLFVMAMSGLQILVAYPYLGPRGQLATWWPLQGWNPPEWMRLGQWLAGARHWHFAFAWLLVSNGLAYLGYFFARGEWRRRVFLPRRDARHAVQMALHYVLRRKEPANAGLYNGLQRLGYTAAIVLVALEVLSGLALYKPVQLRWLTTLFGGYDGARAVHLVALFALVGFVIGHVAMVLLHPRTLIAMITGGKRDE